MRVLLVSHRFPPDGIAGVEQYTQRLASELVKAGDTVSIVARRWADSSSEPQPGRETLPDGATLYRFVGGTVRYERFLVHHERLEQLFTAALVEAAPDVVHVNHLQGLSPRFLEIAHRLRTAVVLSLHDLSFACPLAHLRKRTNELCDGPDGGRECGRSCFANDGDDPTLRWGLRTLYFRRLLAIPDRLVAGSRYVASFFEKFAPGPCRVRVIPNGVPPEEVEPAAAPRSTPGKRGSLNLVYWGTVVPHKGVHVILDAVRIAKLPRVNLLVIGHVPNLAHIADYTEELRRKAAAIPELKFRAYGLFQRAELPHLLHDTDCVIVPSLVPEAGPLVPREALARGIPVLAAGLGALPEIVTDGENGFTFDPKCPGDLAAILRRLVYDGDLVGRLREGVRRTPIVTMPQHTDAVRGVYREAIDELMRRGGVCRDDLAEVGFVHRRLVDLGFGSLR
jgi:glycosyltransferase involved in cell wall biosynthesis